MIYTENAAAEMAANGYGWLNGADFDLTGEEARGLKDFAQLYDHLVLDAYLDIEGTTRLRRYSRYDLAAATGELARLPHEPFYQAAEHNSLFGDQPRNFEPCPPQIDENPYFLGLVGLVSQALPERHEHWLMRAHMIRTKAGSADSPAQPVPEGAHRDGYDFIGVHLIGRTGVSGGDTSILDGDREVKTGTLSEPGDGLILDDRKFLHDTTPIVPAEGNTDGSRDVLLLSFVDADA